MDENTVKEENTAEETVVEENTVEENTAEETVAEENVAEESAAEENAAEVNTVEEKTAEESVEEKTAEETAEKEPMSESEYIEAQKEALKKNIRTWIIILVYLLVVGLVLCLIIYGFLMVAMFVVNLIFFLRTKKFLEEIENGEADVKDIYEFYESMGNRSVKLFALNIFCGGLLGVIGTISDMKVASAGRVEGEIILGDDYKNERISQDVNAKWHYCVYCKRNKSEAFHLYKLTDGVICGNCLSPYSSMLEKRAEDPAVLTSKNTAYFVSPEHSIGGLSSKELEERLEYLKKNQEEYSDFTPTKVLCDGCLEIDETNSLFRVVPVSEFDSGRGGATSGLVHPYSAIKGIAYEMIYEYDYPTDNDNGGWRYTNRNSIILAIDNPYLREETFTLKEIPTKFFANSKKPQIEYAEQKVNELHEIFDKPILDRRKMRR